MSEFICGQNVVLEALDSSVSIERIIIREGRQGSRMQRILNEARKQNIDTEILSPKVFVKVAGAHKSQGVIAFVKDQRYVSVDEILRQSERRKEPPLIALLDGIEDPHNLGAILRAADGAGVHGVVLPKRHAVGVTGTVSKTSAGASAHVFTARVANLNQTVDDLKSHNLWIAAADQQADQTLYEADLSGPLAIVIGSEGRGLRRLVREKCDLLVRIPMYGKINSLNAAVAAALIFYEVRRQRLRTD